MNQKRPMTRGAVSGSDMLTLDELQDGVDVEVPRGGTVRDEDGSDMLGESSPTAEPTVLMSETVYNQDWVRADANTAWAELPCMTIRSPRLGRCGRIEWEYTGTTFHNLSGSETLEFEMMVDGVATGASMTWTNTTVYGSPGIIIFTAALRIVGIEPGTGTPVLFDVDARLIIRDENGATVLDQSKTCRPVIDHTANRDIGWRYRKVSGLSGQAVLLNSAVGWQPLYRTGA